MPYLSYSDNDDNDNVYSQSLKIRHYNGLQIVQKWLQYSSMVTAMQPVDR